MTENKIKQNNTVSKTQQTATGEKIIYKKMKGGVPHWTDDPTIPENLLKEENIFFVKVKVKKVGEGEMLPPKENYDNSYTCFTPLQLEIIENIRGEEELPTKLKAYISGGTIKIANILKGTFEQIYNMGIDDATNVDPNMYIEYIWLEESHYEPKAGDEYAMIIKQVNDHFYKVLYDGYGIFYVEKTGEDTERYRNVVTDKIWEYQR